MDAGLTLAKDPIRWTMLHGATTAAYLMQTLVPEHALRDESMMLSHHYHEEANAGISDAIT